MYGPAQAAAGRKRKARPIKRLIKECSVMTRRYRLLTCLTGVLFATGAAWMMPAKAQAWPERTVRLMTGPAGTSPDATARVLAEALSKRWKQTVVVENRAGADHILAAQGLLDARDGHTLLFTTHSTLTVNPVLHAKLPYEPERDFAPLSLAVEDFLCVVAAPGLGVNSLSELVKVAAARPGALNSYAVPGSPHLSWLAFQKRAGISTTFVSYKTPVAALTDLAADRIHVMVTSFASVRGQVAAGKVKIIAITNAMRAPAAPNVQTAGEAGYPDFTFGGLLGLFGRKDMPPALQERVSSDVRDALREPEVSQRLTNLGLSVRGTTPAEFSAIIAEQRVKWAALAKAHGITPKQD
jgi:tripartite-type tricarboxylate transporter receptor subunit TctC